MISSFSNLFTDTKLAIFSQVTKQNYKIYYIIDTQNIFSQIKKIAIVCKEWNNLQQRNDIWNPILCRLINEANFKINLSFGSPALDQTKMLIRNLKELKTFYLNCDINFLSGQILNKLGVGDSDHSSESYKKLLLGCSPLVMLSCNNCNEDIEYLACNLIEKKEFEAAKRFLLLESDLTGIEVQNSVLEAIQQEKNA